METSLYEQDFALWIEKQAKHIHQRQFDLDTIVINE